MKHKRFLIAVVLGVIPLALYMATFYNCIKLQKIANSIEHSINSVEFCECQHNTQVTPTVSDCYIPMEVPELDTSFKAYMDYRTITNKQSTQYKIQQNAVTDEQGFRMIDGKYLVALGTFYSEQCGEEFDIEFSNGRKIRVVTGDIKQDIHTDSTNRVCKVNDDKYNLVEFIIDKEVMDNKVLRLGDVSVLNMEGKVISINKVI